MIIACGANKERWAAILKQLAEAGAKQQNGARSQPNCSLSVSWMKAYSATAIGKRQRMVRLAPSLVPEEVAVREMLEILTKNKVIGLDCETTGFNPYRDQLEILQLGVMYPKPRQFLVRIKKLNEEEIRSLERVLTNNKVLLTCNGSFDLSYLFLQCNMQKLAAEEGARFFDVCYIHRALARKLIEGHKAEVRLQVRNNPRIQGLREKANNLAELLDSERLSAKERREAHLKLARAHQELQQAIMEVAGDINSGRQLELRRSSSFAALLKRYTGLEADKTERVSDWSQEQLSKEQIRYAALDVAGLFAIAAGLIDELEERNLSSSILQQRGARMKANFERRMREITAEIAQDHIQQQVVEAERARLLQDIFGARQRRKSAQAVGETDVGAVLDLNIASPGSVEQVQGAAESALLAGK